MTYRMNYPASVSAVLVEGKKYKPAALAAMRDFRRSKPFRGTPEERLEKVQNLYRALAAAYGVEVPTVVHNPGAPDCYSPTLHRIRLSNLSVVTALHEFGHALGKDEEQTCRWSINLFRRFFPRAYSRLIPVGHMLRRAR